MNDIDYRLYDDCSESITRLCEKRIQIAGRSVIPIHKNVFYVASRI